MTTAFKQAIAICGLSQQEAAEFLDVRLDIVKSWCSDRNTPPEGAWAELAELYDRMDEAAESARDLINEHKPDKLEFSYSGRCGKWPSVRCADTVEAMIRLRLAIRNRRC